MKILTVVLALCIFKLYMPANLEMAYVPEYRITFFKRKVSKRKKGEPLNSKAPYLINLRNVRKVNTFFCKNQYPRN